VGVILTRHLQGASSRSIFLHAPPDPGAEARSPWQDRQPLGVWAYVKIAEGCSNRCTYCTIPDIRGSLHSRNPEDIRQEVAHLARGGVEEINLVAQDVAGYGGDWKTRKKAPLPDLLRSLHRIDGIQWIRLLYCHPAHVDEALVGAMGDLEKVCPYLDLPVQHVSKPVLKAMNRSYDIRRLRSLIRSLRNARPDIALRTTLMVGFPGEKKEDVERLLRFLEEIRFHHLGVFCYSPETGTAAHALEESVPPEEKEERFQAVMDLQAGISASIQQTYVGTLQKVLVEGDHEEDPGLLQARTLYQAPEVDGMVVIPKGLPTQQGMATARITGSDTYDLFGEICEEAGS